MSNKSYGLGYERKEKKHLEDEGYTANRNRGSFGCFDIVACNKDHFLLESIKSTKKKYYSYKPELEEVREFSNAPIGTIKRFVLYHKGERKILYEGKIEEK